MSRLTQSSTLVVLLAVALGFVLAGGGVLKMAQAQGEMQTGRIAVVAGPIRTVDLPIILVDSREETMMVYEYDMAQKELNLIAARTFRFDKLLAQFEVKGRNGPSVDEVKRAVTAPRR